MDVVGSVPASDVYDPQIRRVDVSGSTLRIASAGSGPPLLMINGIGATVEMWRPLAARLSRSRSLVTRRGELRIIDPAEEIVEHFVANAHLYALNVPQAAIGVEPGTLADMVDRTFELPPLQSQLLRSAVSLPLVGADELNSSAAYFSRAFRREFGLSPRAYRAAHKNRPPSTMPSVADG